MVSVFFHETSETVSDATGQAWFDVNGNENGDKCAWNFGTTSNYNTYVGQKWWLVQQMWTYNPPTDNSANQNSGCYLCYNDCFST